MKYRNTVRIHEVITGAIDFIVSDSYLYNLFKKLLLDGELYSHSLNVAKLSIQLAISLGYDDDYLESIALGGLFHDIGKTQISADILYKAGKLTDEEFQIVKKHPTLGYNLLEGSCLSEDIRLMVLNHHEKKTGEGYPRGLTVLREQDEIITTADIFSALSEHRVYHQSRDILETLEYISTFKDLNNNMLSRLPELVSD